MRVTLYIWRQSGPVDRGRFERHEVDDVDPNMSFLEMLDVLNDRLELAGQSPVVFDHDCREGICGMCSMVINGQAHGPEDQCTACQLHMRSFSDGATIYIEPWRARAFPVIRDIAVDRSALDRIVQAGGFTSARTGSAPDGNAIPISKPDADLAMDAAACIGCGACVAACPNGSAMLFTAAKVSHLALLPQGQPERKRRVQRMVEAMDREMFGACTNYGECQEACPKGISISFISRMNCEYMKASLCSSAQSGDKVSAQ